MSFDKWTVALLTVDRTVIDDMVDSTVEHNLLNLFGPFDTWDEANTWAKSQRELDGNIRTSVIPGLTPVVEDATQGAPITQLQMDMIDAAVAHERGF